MVSTISISLKRLLSLQKAKSLEDMLRWVNFGRRLPPKVGHFCMPADILTAVAFSFLADHVGNYNIFVAGSIVANIGGLFLLYSAYRKPLKKTYKKDIAVPPETSKNAASKAEILHMEKSTPKPNISVNKGHLPTTLPAKAESISVEMDRTCLKCMHQFFSANANCPRCGEKNLTVPT
jgi:hypothetical protein